MPFKIRRGLETVACLIRIPANTSCSLIIWIQNIGPIEPFDGCNPINGNFSAVVLPLCKPDRLKTIGYILECEYSIQEGFLKN